jgi:hypothetical protein
MSSMPCSWRAARSTRCARRTGSLEAGCMRSLAARQLGEPGLAAGSKRPRSSPTATHPGHWSGSWNTKIHGTITRDGNGWVAYLRLEDPPACHSSRPWAGSRPSRKHRSRPTGHGDPGKSSVRRVGVGLTGSCSGSHGERAGGTVPWFPRSPRGPLRAGRPAGLVPLSTGGPSRVTLGLRVGDRSAAGSAGSLPGAGGATSNRGHGGGVGSECTPIGRYALSWMGSGPSRLVRCRLS